MLSKKLFFFFKTLHLGYEYIKMHIPLPFLGGTALAPQGFDCLQNPQTEYSARFFGPHPPQKSTKQNVA